jgi:uridine monophosphate synthetase
VPFFARLSERARQADSLLCVGLDPHPELLPEASAMAAREFCLRVIAATAEAACAFKPNSAFFEAYGAQGIEALRDVIAAVPDAIPVILDAKRGDIASTGSAYARAAFGVLGADAITLSPYLGQDSLAPFLQDPERGVFVLCKTSNPGSDDLQSLALADGQPLFIRLARLAAEWNARDNLGLVVGATDPAALSAVREAAPDLWILAPGVGAQGGQLDAAVRAGLRADGLGLLLPVSRAIAAASEPRREAERLRQAINAVRAGRQSAGPLRSRSAHALPRDLASLADGLLAAGCVRFGEFTLKDGRSSPIYFDLRRLTADPELLTRAADAYMPLLASLRFDRLAAVPYAALPIATAISLRTRRPLVYPRKEPKTYGSGATVEGGFEPGESVVLIDDVATSAASKFEAIERLTAVGLQVRDVVVLIDREAGAGDVLSQAGYQLHAAFTLSRLLDHWERSGTVAGPELAKARAVLGRERARPAPQPG